MENLKKLRKVHGLSQQRFAELFTMSQQSIYKYENDISEPSIQTLKEIATYFNTSIDYLVDYADMPYPCPQRMEGDISHSEKELLENYRHLSPEYKKIITSLIETHLKEIM